MDDLDKKIVSDEKASGNDFEFVTETIKRRPINTKKLIKKILFTTVLAIIFGLVATFTLVIVYPRLYSKLYPVENIKQITLPIAEDEEIAANEDDFVVPKSDVDEDISDVDIAEANSDNKSTEDQENIDSVVESTDNNEDVNDDLVTSEDDKNVVINQVVETVEKNLELEDYRVLIRKISAIANSTEQSLVTVSGRKSNKDWFNNSYVDNKSSIGIILADNGKDLLIISPMDILSSATYVDVTFSDGVTCSAIKKMSDVNTGLGIVAVSLDNIPEDTRNNIAMAEFGSVAASSAGTPVIAVGAPFGIANSMAMGQITSNSVMIDKCDSNVRMILTDIYGSNNATGVIVNYNGRIIGIICHDEALTDMSNLIRAYSAEDIMSTIEKLSNGLELAWFGIKGTDVTKEANETYSVPMGAYVKEVIVDSPAMNVGIRNGDVITKLGTVQINSFVDYQDAMLMFKPGDTVAVTLQRPSGSSYTDVTYEVTMEEYNK